MPLSEFVGPDTFPRHQHANTRWTTWVVLPPTVIELATGATLAWHPGGIVAALLVRQLA